MNQDQNTELQFKSINPKLKGVGGWLLFFVIGQMLLRPARTLTELSDDKNIVTPAFEAIFPTATTLIGIEKAFSIGLAAFGVAVGISLWKMRNPFSVKLTKAFLIANPVIMALDAIVFKFSDLPPDIQDSIMQKGLIQAGAVAIVCLIWFLYFTKSERVRATYYGDIDSLKLS
jgi:undecaprenyl pyrophosphate phosphatase UppP